MSCPLIRVSPAAQKHQINVHDLGVIVLSGVHSDFMTGRESDKNDLNS